MGGGLHLSDMRCGWWWRKLRFVGVWCVKCWLTIILCVFFVVCRLNPPTNKHVYWQRRQKGRRMCPLFFLRLPATVASSSIIKRFMEIEEIGYVKCLLNCPSGITLAIWQFGDTWTQKTTGYVSYLLYYIFLLSCLTILIFIVTSFFVQQIHATWQINCFSSCGRLTWLPKNIRHACRLDDPMYLPGGMNMEKTSVFLIPC